ncbi:LamG-like jellyroll fold domain-containing protein [Aeoliella mucimassa]|uniref:PEP-CTERM motif protein n=1 Tax=Aeoliella mucimassa TaxID=2527972 RepID=A0A518AMT5_9BACT|nr:LamG-like jellyroll fold domain-containing protein [Aeoliella mucimassa]QDU56032.1 PEP-CTERM motif protein [Aeoliella mucimassa]
MQFDPSDSRTLFMNGYEDNRYGTVPAADFGDHVGWVMDTRVPSIPAPDPDNGLDEFLDAQQGNVANKPILGYHPAGMVLDYLDSSDNDSLLIFEDDVALADGYNGAADVNMGSLLLTARVDPSGTGNSYFFDFRDDAAIGGGTNSNDGFGLRYNHDTGELEGMIKQSVAVSVPVPSGEWFAASLVWNGPSSTATLKVETLAGSNSISGAASDVALDVDRARMGNNSNGNSGLKGQIGGVLYYNDIDDHTSTFNSLAQDYVVPLPELTIDRETGNISITVPAGASALTNIAGYSITSDAETLNPGQWLSIAENYDAGSPGPNQVDPDNNWTKLSASNQRSDLTELEFEQSGGANNGADFVAGSSMNLGNAWIRYYNEDVKASLVLDDGTVMPLQVNFVGNGGESFEFGDLDFDGDIDQNDFFDVFVPNYGVDTSSTVVSQPERYGLGDLNDDGSVSLEDFILLNDAYLAANPGAASLSLEGVSVPEPTTAVIMGMVLLVLSCCSPWRRLLLSVAVCLCATAMLTPSANAAIGGVLDVDFEYLTPDTTIGDGSRIQDLSGNRYHGFWGGGASDANNTPIELAYAGSTTVINNEDANGFVILRDGLGDGGSEAPNAWFGEEATPSPYFTLGANTSYTFEAVLNWNGDDRGRDGIMGQTGGAEWWIREDSGNIEYVFDDGPNRHINTGTIYVGDLIDNAEWHHLGITYERATSDPTQVTVTTYLDYTEVYQEVLSAGLGEVGDGTADVRLGAYNTSSSNRFDGLIDHFRISDQVLSTNEFLPLPEPPSYELVVNKDTGLVMLVNQTGTDLTFDSYRLTSESDSLNPSGWLSLDDQNVAAPEDWTELGSTASELSEGIFGSTWTLASGEFQSLGTAYADLGQEDTSLKFEYHVQGESGFREIMVSYVVGLQGDFNDDGIVNLADYTVWRDNLGADESTIANKGDGANGVDMADYNLWKANFGLSSSPVSGLSEAAVPEPSTLFMLVIGVVAVAGRKVRVAGQKLLLTLLSASWCVLASNANATTNDRQYLFGDSGSTDPAVGGVSVGEGVAMGFLFNSNMVTGDEIGPSGGYQDLIVDGATYTSVSNRPGAGAGEWGANFNGAASLSTPLSLNRPSDFWDNTTFFVNGEFPKNYEGIYSHGIQLWARPDTTALTAGDRQDLVIDTPENGVYITDSGNWGLQFDGGGDSGVSVASTLDSNGWAHVMQVGGYQNLSQGNSAYQSVLFVNGVAVYATSETQNMDADSTSLSVGSNQAGDGNFYTGVMDNLEMFLWGDNSDELGADGSAGGTNGIGGLNADGQNWGAFSLFDDNHYISHELSSLGIGTLQPGDVDLDGSVDADDVTALVEMWDTPDHVVNGITIGDWGTRQSGDLNVDGRVDLYDAVILRSELLAAGLGSIDLSIFAGGNQVPEPSSFAVLLLATVVAGVAFRKVRA